MVRHICPYCEIEDHLVRKIMRHFACPICEGSGMATKWVSLQEFAELLTQSQCSREHTAYQGCMQASGGWLYTTT